MRKIFEYMAYILTVVTLFIPLINVIFGNFLIATYCEDNDWTLREIAGAMLTWSFISIFYSLFLLGRVIHG